MNVANNPAIIFRAMMSWNPGIKVPGKISGCAWPGKSSANIGIKGQGIYLGLTLGSHAAGSASFTTTPEAPSSPPRSRPILHQSNPASPSTAATRRTTLPGETAHKPRHWGNLARVPIHEISLEIRNRSRHEGESFLFLSAFRLSAFRLSAFRLSAFRLSAFRFI